MFFRRFCSFTKLHHLKKSIYGLKGESRKCLSTSNIIVSDEVREALRLQNPVVALESTIITHGMPFPHNLGTARSVENIIRKQGAVPATIAILEGRVHVGLTDSQLEQLALGEQPAVKTSRRDFAHVCAKKLNGGTTVSGTMLIAKKVGIRIFVTGGIGGVHRGAESSMDISADLTELGRTPVMVVSAGVKSILDIPRTLEFLETQGVCVSVLGPSKKFPDFFTRDSGQQAPSNVETPFEAAVMLHKQVELNIDSGMLLAVPIPEEYEGDGNKIKEAIEVALAEASSSVAGRDVTPFILKRVNELTQGHSLESNIALIENNAKFGAQIAVSYAELRNPRKKLMKKKLESNGSKNSTKQGMPVVIGGSIVDFIITVNEPHIKFSGQTHLGKIRQSYGGVGRNMGDALTRLSEGSGHSPLLISAIGTDTHGTALLKHNPKMDTHGICCIEDSSTAVYSVVLDQKGEALFGIGDMSIHAQVTPQLIRKFEEEIASSRLVLLDGNMEQRTIDYVLDFCGQNNVPVWYEPTDLVKASKPWIGSYGHHVTFASPNLNELNTICSYLKLGKVPSLLLESGNNEEALSAIVRLLTPLMDDMAAIMVSLGQEGFMIVRRVPAEGATSPLLPQVSDTNSTKSIATDESIPIQKSMSFYNPLANTEEGTVVGLHFAAPSNPKIVSVSGAGDCLAAGFITGMLEGRCIAECSAFGVAAAKLSLGTSAAIPSTLSPQMLPWDHKIPYVLIK